MGLAKWYYSRAVFKRGNGECRGIFKTGNIRESLKRGIYRGIFKTGNFGESLKRVNIGEALRLWNIVEYYF